LAEDPQRTWVGRGIILGGVMLIAWIIGGVLSYFVPQSGLSLTLDRVLGAVFGALRGVTLIALAVMLAHAVQLDRVNWWKNSKALPYAESVSNWIGGFAQSARAE
jgi:membrane protein required for colicin V production